MDFLHTGAVLTKIGILFNRILGVSRRGDFKNTSFGARKKWKELLALSFFGLRPTYLYLGL
jgi:hypothetical protein